MMPKSIKEKQQYSFFSCSRSNIIEDWGTTCNRGCWLLLLRMRCIHIFIIFYLNFSGEERGFGVLG
ncbi:MAG: hypothetical protein WCG04_07465, partial [Alphaproteobacteria bacterium]